MYCRYCGGIIEDNARFCSHCGNGTSADFRKDTPAPDSSENSGSTSRGQAIAGFILSLPVLFLTLFIAIVFIPELFRTTAQFKAPSAPSAGGFGMYIPLSIFIYFYIGIPAIIFSSIGLKKSKGWILSKLGFIFSLTPYILIFCLIISRIFINHTDFKKTPRAASYEQTLIYDAEKI